MYDPLKHPGPVCTQFTKPFVVNTHQHDTCSVDIIALHGNCNNTNFIHQVHAPTAFCSVMANFSCLGKQYLHYAPAQQQLLLNLSQDHDAADSGE